MDYFKLREVIVACDVTNRDEITYDTMTYLSNISFLRTEAILDEPLRKLSLLQEQIGTMLSHAHITLHDIFMSLINPQPQDYLQFSFAAFDQDITPLKFNDTQLERDYSITQQARFGMTLALENIETIPCGHLIAKDALIDHSELKVFHQRFVKTLEKIAKTGL